MKYRPRALIQLVLAAAAAVGSVLSWLAASFTVTVAPVVTGQPSTTSMVYSPPLLVLSLSLVTAAGVLAVLGIANLRPARAETESPVADGAPSQP
jgi:hypothetical protein